MFMFILNHLIFSLANVKEIIEIIYTELYEDITLNTFFRFRYVKTVSLSPFIYQKVQSNAFS